MLTREKNQKHLSSQGFTAEKMSEFRLRNLGVTLVNTSNYRLSLEQSVYPCSKSTSSTSVRGGSSLPKLTLDKPVLPSIGISFNDDDGMESNLTVESIGKVCSTEMFSCSGRKLLDFCALVTFYSGPC